MLVLSRKTGERILIGENTVITVVRISNGTVRIGIEAPSGVTIIREEMAHQDSAERTSLLNSGREVPLAPVPVLPHPAS